MAGQVSQNNFSVPEAIKLNNTSKLFSTDTLFTNHHLKIDSIFQMLSNERHGGIVARSRTPGLQK